MKTDSSTVFFLNRWGEKLYGTLHHPQVPSEYGVVMGHCFTCTRHTGILRESAVRLTDAGFHVLRFDFSGNGQSEGNFIDTTFSKLITEMEDAVDFLKSVGVKCLGLVGHSMGAAISILSVARLSGIKAVCTIAGRLVSLDPAQIFTPQQILQFRETGRLQFVSRGRQLELKERFIDDMCAYDIRSVVALLRLPLLVIHGTQDDIIPADQAVTSQMINPDLVELYLIPGADHFFSQEEHQDTVARKIAAWFVNIRERDRGLLWKH